MNTANKSFVVCAKPKRRTSLETTKRHLRAFHARNITKEERLALEAVEARNADR